MWIGWGRTTFEFKGLHSFRILMTFGPKYESSVNISGLFARGFKWKIVLWKSVVSYLRCFFEWEIDYDVSVLIFYWENEGIILFLIFIGDSSVFKDLFLLLILIQDYIIVSSLLINYYHWRVNHLINKHQLIS